MDRCKFCDLQFLKYDAINHIKEYCSGERLCQFRQFSEKLKYYIELLPTDECFVCHQLLTEHILFDHLRQCHPRCIFLLSRIVEHLNVSPDTTITYCVICGEEMLSRVAMFHLTKRHPESLSMLYYISEKMIAFQPQNPERGSCKICDILFLHRKAVDYLQDYQAESIILIHQLRLRLKWASDSKLKFSTQDSCKVCGEKFQVSEFIKHLAVCHPEALSLVQIFNKYGKCYSRNERIFCTICKQRISNKFPMNHFSIRHPKMIKLSNQMSAQMPIAIKNKPRVPSINNPEVRQIMEALDVPFNPTKIPIVTKNKPASLPSSIQNHSLEVNQIIEAQNKGPTEVKNITSFRKISWTSRKRNSSIITNSAQFYLKRALSYKKRATTKKPFQYSNAHIGENRIQEKMQNEKSASDIQQIQEPSSPSQEKTYFWSALANEFKEAQRHKKKSASDSQQIPKPSFPPNIQSHHSLEVNQIIKSQNKGPNKRKNNTYLQQISYTARKKNSSVITNSAQFYLKRALSYKKRATTEKPFRYSNAHIGKNQIQKKMQNEESAFDCQQILKPCFPSNIQSHHSLEGNQIIKAQNKSPKKIKNKTSLRHISWIAKKSKSSVIMNPAQFYLKRALLYKKREKINKKPFLFANAHIGKNRIKKKIQLPFPKFETLAFHKYEEYKKAQLNFSPQIQFNGPQPPTIIILSPAKEDTQKELNETESKNFEAMQHQIIIPGKQETKCRESISDSCEAFCYLNERSPSPSLNEAGQYEKEEPNCDPGEQEAKKDGLCRESISDSCEAFCYLPERSPSPSLNEAGQYEKEEPNCDPGEEEAKKDGLCRESISDSCEAFCNLHERSPSPSLNEASQYEKEEPNCDPGEQEAKKDELCRESISDTREAFCNLPERNPSPSLVESIQYEKKKLNYDPVKREKEIKARKQKEIKAMLKKYHEKETKKEVLYWQKGLTKYVTQQRDTLAEFEDKLINARHYLKGARMGPKLLKELNSIPDEKIRKKVRFLVTKLLDALKKVPKQRITFKE